MTRPFDAGPVIVAGQRVWLGQSSTDGLRFLAPGSVDLVMTSPLYWAGKASG